MSSAMSEKKCEVFLCFVESDTSPVLVDCLYRELNKAGVATFKSYQKFGYSQDELSTVNKALKVSKICVVVLSPAFDGSVWCLSQVAEMVEMKKQIVPIFYGVTPDDVDEFSSYVVDNHGDLSGRGTAQNWSNALEEIARIEGREMRDDMGLVEFCNDITDYILGFVRDRSFLIGRKCLREEPQVTEVINYVYHNNKGQSITLLSHTSPAGDGTADSTTKITAIPQDGPLQICWVDHQRFISHEKIITPYFKDNKTKTVYFYGHSISVEDWCKKLYALIEKHHKVEDHGTISAWWWKHAEDFIKSIARDVGSAMKALHQHQEGLCHGNIPDGIFFGVELSKWNDTADTTFMEDGGVVYHDNTDIIERVNIKTDLKSGYIGNFRRRTADIDGNQAADVAAFAKVLVYMITYADVQKKTPGFHTFDELNGLGIADLIAYGTERVVVLARELAEPAKKSAEAAIESAEAVIKLAGDEVELVEKHFEKAKEWVGKAKDWLTEASIESAGAAIESAEAEMESAEAEMESAEAAIELAEAPRKSVEKHLAKAKEWLVKAKNWLAEAPIESAGTKKWLAEAVEQLAKAEEQLMKAKDQLAEAEKHLEKAKEWLAKAEEWLTEAEEQLGTAREKLGDLKSFLKCMGQQVGTNSTELNKSEIEKPLAEVDETNFAEDYKRLVELDKKLKNIQKQLVYPKKPLTAYKRKKGEAEEQLVKIEVQSAETEVAKGWLGKFKERLRKAKEQLLEQQVPTNSTCQLDTTQVVGTNSTECNKSFPRGWIFGHPYLFNASDALDFVEKLYHFIFEQLDVGVFTHVQSEYKPQNLAEWTTRIKRKSIVKKAYDYQRGKNDENFPEFYFSTIIPEAYRSTISCIRVLRNSVEHHCKELTNPNRRAKAKVVKKILKDFNILPDIFESMEELIDILSDYEKNQHSTSGHITYVNNLFRALGWKLRSGDDGDESDDSDGDEFDDSDDD